jgi:hypothetical protein
VSTTESESRPRQSKPQEIFVHRWASVSFGTGLASAVVFLFFGLICLQSSGSPATETYQSDPTGGAMTVDSGTSTLLAAFLPVAVAVVTLQITALVTGLHALDQLDGDKGREQGKGLAISGVTLGSVGLILDIPLGGFLYAVVGFFASCPGGC